MKNNSNNESVLINKNIIILALILLMGSIFSNGYFLAKASLNNGASNTTTAQNQQAAPQPAANLEINKVKELFNNKNITFGNPDSKILFVEFSDPSCPFCHVASGVNETIGQQMGQQFLTAKQGGSYVPPEPEMKKLVDQGKAAMVWMYANGHGNGEMATQAFYCANEMGKFWEVHNKLMSAEGYDLINNTVKNDATKAGLIADFLKGAVDSQKMKACLESGKYAERLTQDMTTAQSMGFQGTPYFIINTTPFAGAYSYTDMQSTVDLAAK